MFTLTLETPVSITARQDSGVPSICNSSLKDRLLETHSKIIVFVVNFYQEMKRFLKLFSCTKATDVDSASSIEFANQSPRNVKPSIEYANFVQGD